MPSFLKCSVESFEYRSSAVQNKPVNLDLCTSLSKSKFAWYPDNTGRPSIKFNGCDTEWSYSSEEVRDAEFDLIATNSHPVE